MKFIKNGRLILKDRILTGKAIAYDDRIIGFVDNDAVPAGAEVIDAAGAYVAPGLIDVHIHGYLGQDVCDCNPDGIRKIAAGIVQNGVTGFLPTTMTVSMDTIEKAIDVCRSLKEESKTWKGTAILGEIVSDTDVVVSMGHTDATFDVAAAGIVNGVRSTTHLFNAMSALGHRNPGVVGAALKYDVYTELIVDTFHVDKSLYSIVGKQKGEKLVFITDCLPAGGLPEGEYTLGGQRFIAKGIECRLPDGTIAGSVLKLNKGVWNVYTNSDMPLYEAVNCASLHPATLIGLGRTKGSLDIGKDADIILADDSFNVLKTIIGGTIRYEG